MILYDWSVRQFEGTCSAVDALLYFRSMTTTLCGLYLFLSSMSLQDKAPSEAGGSSGQSSPLADWKRPSLLKAGRVVCVSQHKRLERCYPCQWRKGNDVVRVYFKG